MLLGERVSDEVVRDSWNIAAGASPIGTWSCPPTWHTDFRDDLTHIDVPTLVMHGDADRILPIEATGARTHEAIKGSRFVVVEGAPHGMLWTQADEVNRALLDFLGAEAMATRPRTHRPSRPDHARRRSRRPLKRRDQRTRAAAQVRGNARARRYRVREEHAPG